MVIQRPFLLSTCLLRALTVAAPALALEAPAAVQAETSVSATMPFGSFASATNANAAAALLLASALAALPAAAQGGTALATDRYAPSHLLDFWRSHGPGATVGNDPSENAPGWFRDAPPLHAHLPATRLTRANGTRATRRRSSPATRPGPSPARPAHTRCSSIFRATGMRIRTCSPASSSRPRRSPGSPPPCS